MEAPSSDAPEEGSAGPGKACEVAPAEQQQPPPPLGPPDEDDAEEPRLKYQRLGAVCSDLLAGTAATCMRVEDKMIMLGTKSGHVHLLDYNGNQIRCFEAHKGAVNELSFDARSDFIASCSDDGSVVVHSLYDGEVTRLKYGRGIKSVALDPFYGSRKDRQIACGGLAGQLTLNSRGWLGPKDAVLHKGEGPVTRIRWSGALIAWANDAGVRIYDTQAHQRLGFVERKYSPGHEAAAGCSLFWEGDTHLYIGRGNSVQVVRVAHEERPLHPAASAAGAACAAGGAKGPGVSGNSVGAGAGSHVHTSRVVQIVAAFRTDYVVAGLAPFGRNLAVLALASPGGGGAADAAPPELRIVTWQNQELASDVLTLNGHEKYGAADYSLAAFHPMSCHGGAASTSAAAATPPPSLQGGQPTKWWLDGYEPLYYIVSPKDVVLARPRDGEDRVAWMLERKRFEEALVLVERGEASKASTRERVLQAYLDHLMATSQYQKAAAMCPRLLQGNIASWERWVYMFAQARQLPTLAPFIPVQDPRLRTTAYEVVLSSFLPNEADHPGLLVLLRTWPCSGLYSNANILKKALARMDKYGGSLVMKEVAAELYQMQGKFEDALEMLLQVQRKDVFLFMNQHDLLATCARKHVVRLMEIDEQQCLQLLIDNWEQVPPENVVTTLQHAAAKASKTDAKAANRWARALHEYLHMLFLKDPDAATGYHGLQVELYAEYDPQRLMYFLTHSQQYPLEEAYEICKERGLVKEMVFILGRMGNAAQALSLIMDELGDVPQAVEFVHEQRDDELWDVLIAHAIGSPKLATALLQDIGSYCNPLRLLTQIPEGLEIPGLRDSLVKIISDFRTQMSLREGCNRILQHDCVTLARRLYDEARKAAPHVYCHRSEASADGQQGDRQWFKMIPGQMGLHMCTNSVPAAVAELSLSRKGKENAAGDNGTSAGFVLVKIGDRAEDAQPGMAHKSVGGLHAAAGDAAPSAGSSFQASGRLQALI